jgi:hypothetical protein
MTWIASQQLQVAPRLPCGIVWGDTGQRYIGGAIAYPYGKWSFKAPFPESLSISMYAKQFGRLHYYYEELIKYWGGANRLIMAQYTFH